MRALSVKLPTERSVRLVAGRSCMPMRSVTSSVMRPALSCSMPSRRSATTFAPWRTPLGLTILLICFLVHLSLGLRALYGRRHLRMPALEGWQLGLGLVAPLLLVPHVTDARLGVQLYGFDDSYFRVLYLFWLTEPGTALPRQFALLVVVWIHGSIGIHMWLRFRP
jgi:adenylate cyclase